MIQSMTGFGKAEAMIDNKTIHVEIKSLNSKSADIQTRIAPLFREKDIEIRQMLANKLIRGKIDFAIWIEKDVATDAQIINASLDNIVAFRTQEGKALQEKFLEKADNIEKLMLSIEPFEKERVEKIRQRIEEGLKNIPNVEYDRNRLEQELIYYIEKLDIS